jgi:hypothetical protein
MRRLLILLLTPLFPSKGRHVRLPGTAVVTEITSNNDHDHDDYFSPSMVTLTDNPLPYQKRPYVP